MPRPCPWASCRWNLLVDVDAGGQVHERPQPAWSTSCALDESEAGTRSLDEVGELLGGLSREGARAIEAKALTVFVRRASTAGIIDRPAGLWWWDRSRRDVPDRMPAPTENADEEQERDSDRGRVFVSFFSDAADERVSRSIANMIDKQRRSATEPETTTTNDERDERSLTGDTSINA